MASASLAHFWYLHGQQCKQLKPPYKGAQHGCRAEVTKGLHAEHVRTVGARMSLHKSGKASLSRSRQNARGVLDALLRRAHLSDDLSEGPEMMSGVLASSMRMESTSSITQKLKSRSTRSSPRCSRGGQLQEMAAH